MIGIYKITFNGTNKCYIGSSFNIATRKTTHLNYFSNNNHHSVKLQNAFNKYGIDNLIFEVIEECFDVTRDELFEREQFYIDKYNSFSNGYNMSPSAWTYIHEWSEEDKKAKSESMLGELNHFYGKSHTPETIEKIKASRKDTTGHNNPFYGKKHSDESKEKFRQSMRMRMESPEYVHPLKGVPKPQKSIEKMKSSMPHSIKCIIDGVEYPSVSEAAKKLNVNTKTITQRLGSPYFLNYISDVIPKREKKVRSDLTSCIIDGIAYSSASAASVALGIKYSTIMYRINSNNYPNYQSTRATTIENTSLSNDIDGSE